MLPTAYHDAIQLIERVHRRFLDVVKLELDKNQIPDLNPVQAMILYNIGEDDMTVGELTLRGYYLGSNVSYNVKKMVENNYIIQERSVHDKRSIRVRLSDQGLDLYENLYKMFARHEEEVGDFDLGQDRIKDFNETIKQLERFWASQTTFTGLDSLEWD
ncbi:MAG: MarR family transcriptional regulator [Alphaproteobacteria bacterium]|nr:MAG: MarR family transcriptional regulator [Alphaproteobacteria bacterium]